MVDRQYHLQFDSQRAADVDAYLEYTRYVHHEIIHNMIFGRVYIIACHIIIMPYTYAMPMDGSWPCTGSEPEPDVAFVFNS